MKAGRALVTAIGSLSASAVLNGLRELGFSIVGTDIYPAEWIAESAGVDSFYRAPRADEEGYTAFMRELIIKENISLFIPLTDVEIDVINAHRADFSDISSCVVMSGELDIALIRNKLLLTERVAEWLSGEKNGSFGARFRTIPSFRADEADYDEIGYPMVLKPVNGRSSEGLYRIYHEDQLGFAMSCIVDNTKLIDTSLEKYIAQPMLKGNVITADVVRDRHGNTRVLCREELIRTQNGAGISVRVFRDEELEDFCSRLSGELCIVGAVNFEFILGEGSGCLYFVECNPRFSGGVAFSVLAGEPMVKNGIRAVLGEKLFEDSEPVTGFMTREYTECRM